MVLTSISTNRGNANRLDGGWQPFKLKLTIEAHIILCHFLLLTRIQKEPDLCLARFWLAQLFHKASIPNTSSTPLIDLIRALIIKINIHHKISPPSFPNRKLIANHSLNLHGALNSTRQR
jgi:hypothetical protein